MTRSVLVTGMIILSGSFSVAASEPTVNAFCPVLPDQPGDPNITTVYQGTTVAFCCDHCLAKFTANPDKYVKHLPQFAQVGGPEEHTAHGHTDDHGHEIGDAEEKAMPFLARLHPVVVHFPVAGVPLAFLSVLIWLATGREAFSKADIPALLGAAAGAVVAVITGNVRHDTMRFGATLHEIVEQHQVAGTTVMVLCLVLVVFRIWRWNRMTGTWGWLYAGGLAVVALVVGVTGYLGGSLVYGPDHFKW